MTVIINVRDEQLFENMTAHSILELNMSCEAELIRRRGQADGHSVSTWIVDGNTEDSQLERLIRGIEEGDPMYLDQLPTPRLGGEMAGEPTWEDILRDELHRPPNDDGEMDLLNVYEDAFRDAVEDGLNQIARHRRAIK